MVIKRWYQNLLGPLTKIWCDLVPNAKIRDFMETVIWAVVLALLLRAFVVQAFYIPSGSMIPTLLPNDRVLVNKFIYTLRAPQRGDVFVFEYPEDPSKDYVKRLIALPGDTFEMRQGTVYINGAPVKEDYVKYADSYSMAPVVVPKDSFVALGDNRPNSADSRFWGYVSRSAIKGPVFLRYWPLNRFGLID